MWPFGSKDKGKKVNAFGSWIKCEHCNHDRHLNINHRTGKRFDRVRAECAKCGKETWEDGPFHTHNPNSRSVTTK